MQWSQTGPAFGLQGEAAVPSWVQNIPWGWGGHELAGHELGLLQLTVQEHDHAIAQIVHLATAPRSGEIILSASRDWDFRARYEPIAHISSHGALHREHMLVPLLVNQAVKRQPRRTVDVMPSALAALGLPVPPGLDGESFL